MSDTENPMSMELRLLLEEAHRLESERISLYVELIDKARKRRDLYDRVLKLDDERKET